MRVAHARAICCEDRSWGGKGTLDRTPALRRLRPRLCKLPSGCAPAGDVYTRSMAPAAILLLLLTAEASVVRHPLSHLRLARLTSVSRCEPARLTGVVDTASETEETDEWAEFEAWINRKKQQEEEEARPRQGRTPSPFALNWYLPRHRPSHVASRAFVRVAGPSWTVTSTGHQHDHFFSNRARSFEELGAPPRLVSNLASLGVTRPSCAQAASYECMMKGEDCVINHAAGTGKTLAFVAPLVARLWEWEQADGRTPPGEVRVIVIVPTPELGQQVLQTAREVASRSIRASIATGEHKWSSQRERLRSGLDVLVTTMGRLVAHLNPRGVEPSFSLRGTRAIVVDEADSLYQGEVPSWLMRQRGRTQDAARLADELWHAEGGGNREGSSEPPLAMWKWLRNNLPSSCTTTLVSASLPTKVEGQMRIDVGLDLRALRGRGVHTTRPGVTTTLVDCSAPVFLPDGRPSLFEAKVQEMVERVHETPILRTVALCNSARTTERLARALRENLPPSWRILRFHASLTPRQRSEYLASFRAEPSASDGEDATPRILVATGRAAKGLSFADGVGYDGEGSDGEPTVGHVVLFEFPPDAKAYIARVGFATRGDEPSAQLTALAVGKQLPFARAMLNQDKEGSAHRVD